MSLIFIMSMEYSVLYENSEHRCAFVPATILKCFLDACVGFPLFQPEIRRAGVI